MKFDKIYNKLSYPMKMKTNSIINFIEVLNEINDKMSEINWIYYIFGFIGLSTISFIHFIPYFNYLFSSFVNETATYNFSLIDYLLLFLLIVGGVITLIKTWQFTTLKNRKKEFENKRENLRLDIIENIEHDFCKCDLNCNCKEEYIKYMEKEYDLDLIFK